MSGPGFIAVDQFQEACERHKAFVRAVRANLWFATAMVETEKLDDAIVWIRQAITLCDAELGKEGK